MGEIESERTLRHWSRDRLHLLIFDRRAITVAFVASSPKRRVLTTLALLFFVAFVVPYQFAYMVACIVQLATCVRALRYAYDNVS